METHKIQQETVMDHIQINIKSNKLKTMSKSKGLGDTIEKITKATGIKAVVEKVSEVTGKPCGCQQRRDTLNRVFPYDNK